MITDNLNLATAFGTCGCPVQLHDQQTEDLANGRLGIRRTLFHVGDRAPDEVNVLPDSPPVPPAMRQHIDQVFAMCYFQPLAFSADVMKARLDRAYLAEVKTWLHPLEEAEPLHPLLDCIAGLDIREKLLSMSNGRDSYTLQVRPLTPRAYLVRGTPEATAEAVFNTPDLGLASALLRVGIPLVQITGPEGNRLYHFPQRGLELPRIGSLDALLMARAIADNTLCTYLPEHPANWVITAVRNRTRVLRYIEGNEADRRIFFDSRSSAFHRKNRSAMIVLTGDAGIDRAKIDNAQAFVRRGA